MNFSCPQHQCWDCQQKTADAGGMIFRCRWCERGYCEDCLDWDKTELFGDNLKEYELLGYPPVNQAYYIYCPSCTDYHTQNQDHRDFCTRRAIEIDAQHLEMIEEEEAKKSINPRSRSETQSLTDATTLDESGVSTPQPNLSSRSNLSSKTKRKAAPAFFKPDLFTLKDSEALTRVKKGLDLPSPSGSRKRKVAAGPAKMTPTKRSRQLAYSFAGSP